jgi:hypothetical protein
MKTWGKLLALPQADQIQKFKTFAAILVWILGFIVAVRGLALVQFLMELDYSEVNLVRLIQFVFLKLLILCFFLYYMRLIWTRPHRLALLFLMFLCVVSLYQYRDLVSLFSSITIGIIAFLLYLKLHIVRREPLAIK